MMFAYGPELYELQSWSTAGDANYLLDSHAQATNLLSCKLVCMYNRVGPDDPNPSRAAFLLVQLHLILQHTRQPDLIPTPGLHLVRPKWKSPTPAQHQHLLKEIKPKSPAGSGGEDSDCSDSTSQECSETNEEDEAGSDGEASGDGEGSDGGSSDGQGSNSGG